MHRDLCVKELSRAFSAMRIKASPSPAKLTSPAQRRRFAARAKPPINNGNGTSDKDEERLQKRASLQNAIDSINKTFGKGSIMLASERPKKVDTFPTGAMTLDVALGGGWPRGRIVEIYGPEASGKTALATAAMKEVQKAGGDAALVDAEHAFSPEFAKHQGVDLERLLVTKPLAGEEALEQVLKLVQSRSLDLIIVDSVAALVTKAEIESEMGAATMATQARLMSSALRKLTPLVESSSTCLMFINQLRSKVGMAAQFGNPEVTSGGNALKYFASARVDVRRTKRIAGKGKDADDIGIKIRAKVTKLKYAPPFRSAEYDFLFSRGIDTAGCILDAAEKLGVVTRKGAWYYLGEGEDAERLGNGRDNVTELLTADVEKLRALEAKTLEKIRDIDNPDKLLLQTDNSEVEEFESIEEPEVAHV